MGSWRNSVTLEQLKKTFFSPSFSVLSFSVPGNDCSIAEVQRVRSKGIAVALSKPTSHQSPTRQSWCVDGHCESKGKSSSLNFLLSSIPPDNEKQKHHSGTQKHFESSNSCYRPHIICCWPQIETSVSRGWWFLRSWIISFAGFKKKTPPNNNLSFNQNLNEKC